VWTQITVDEELGLVYLPVESPSSDYYGGKRPGNNLYGESLVAVDLKTGQRKWHFQLVHHPIWDHDISSAPILLDVTIDGRMRKLVAQPTKQSFLYVFDRVTGEPIWPIVETAVPPGDVPGEWYAATQPIPSKPPAYGRPGLRIPDDLAVIAWDYADYGTVMIPPMSVILPPWEEVGEAAMELLLRRIAKPEIPPRQVILSCTLVVAGSTQRATH